MEELKQPVRVVRHDHVRLLPRQAPHPVATFATPRTTTTTIAGTPRTEGGTEVILDQAQQVKASWRDFIRSREGQRTHLKQELGIDSEFLEAQKQDQAYRSREAALRSQDLVSNVLTLTSNFERVRTVIDQATEKTREIMMQCSQVQLRDDDDQEGFSRTLFTDATSDSPLKSYRGTSMVSFEKDKPPEEDNLDVESASSLGLIAMVATKPTSCSHELASLFNALDEHNFVTVDVIPSPGVQSLFETLITPMSSSNKLRKKGQLTTSVVLKNPKMTYTTQSWSVKKNILESILKGTFDINHVAAMRCHLEWTKRELAIARQQLCHREEDVVRAKVAAQALTRQHTHSEIKSQTQHDDIVSLLSSVRSAMMAVDEESAMKIVRRKKQEMAGELGLEEGEDEAASSPTSPRNSSSPDRYTRVVVELEGLIHRARKGTFHQTNFAQSSWFHKNLLAKLTGKVEARRRNAGLRRRQEVTEVMLMESHDCMSAVDQIFSLGDNVTLRIAHILRMLNSEQREQLVGAAGHPLLLDPLLTEPCIDFACPSCGLQFDPSKPSSDYTKLGKSRKENKSSKGRETHSRGVSITGLPPTSDAGLGTAESPSIFPRQASIAPSEEGGGTDDEGEGVGEVVQRLTKSLAEKKVECLAQLSRINSLETQLAQSIIMHSRAATEAADLAGLLSVNKEISSGLTTKTIELESNLKQYTATMAVPYRQMFSVYSEEEHPMVSDMVRRCMALERESTRGFVESEACGVQVGGGPLVEKQPVYEDRAPPPEEPTLVFKAPVIKHDKATWFEQSESDSSDDKEEIKRSREAELEVDAEKVRINELARKAKEEAKRVKEAAKIAAKKTEKYISPDAELPAWGKGAGMLQAVEIEDEEELRRGRDHYMWRFVLKRPKHTIVPFAEDEARKDLEYIESQMWENLMSMERKSDKLHKSLKKIYTKYKKGRGITDQETQCTPRAYAVDTPPVVEGAAEEELASRKSIVSISRRSTTFALERAVKRAVTNVPGLAVASMALGVQLRKELALKRLSDVGPKKEERRVSIVPAVILPAIKKTYDLDNIQADAQYDELKKPLVRTRFVATTTTNAVLGVDVTEGSSDEGSSERNTQAPRKQAHPREEKRSARADQKAALNETPKPQENKPPIREKKKRVLVRTKKGVVDLMSEYDDAFVYAPENSFARFAAPKPAPSPRLLAGPVQGAGGHLGVVVDGWERTPRGL